MDKHPEASPSGPLLVPNTCLVYLLLCHTLLATTVRLALLDSLEHSPRPATCIGVHHELRVAPRHHLNILINRKSVVELSGWLRLAMLNIAHLTIDAHLHASPARLRRAEVLVRLSGDEWRVRVHDCRRKIQDASHRYGVLECGGIERDESWATVSKGSGAAEGQLESLLEQESTEDHEVMPVSSM